MEKAIRKPAADDIQQVAPDLAPFYSTNGIEAVWDFIEDDVVHFKTGKVFPQEDQRYLAEKLCQLLNWNYAHDGRWRVVWTEPVDSKWHPYRKMFVPACPQRMLFQWFIHKRPASDEIRMFDFIIDIDYPDILDVIHNPKDLCVGADGAWQAWHRQTWGELANADDCLIREVKASPIPGCKMLEEVD